MTAPGDFRNVEQPATSTPRLIVENPRRNAGGLSAGLIRFRNRGASNRTGNDTRSNEGVNELLLSRFHIG
jgi:hypothetical protein